MCRHLAYLGPPVPLAAAALRPARTGCSSSPGRRADMRGSGTVNADGFGVGWYAGRRRRRCATAGPRRSGPTPASPTSRAVARSPARCSPPSATATVGMPVAETAAAPFAARAAGCSATTAWSPAGRTSVARAGRARCRSRTCWRSTRPPTRALLWALVRRPAARRGRARQTVADVGHRRGRRGRARLPAEPAAHRRRDGRRHRPAGTALSVRDGGRPRRGRLRAVRRRPRRVGAASPTSTSWSRTPPAPPSAHLS